MGLRGPKPQSPEMMARKGNPGHKSKAALTKKDSFTALEKLPQSPKYIKGTARDEYRRIGVVLVNAGKISVENLKLFEAYCYNYGMFQEIQEKFESKKEDYQTAGPVLPKLSIDCA